MPRRRRAATARATTASKAQRADSAHRPTRRSASADGGRLRQAAAVAQVAMAAARALRLHAGPRARRHIEQHGLRPQDISVVPGAAGGPKGLILGPLDRFIFGDVAGAVAAAGAPGRRLDRRLAHGDRLPGRRRGRLRTAGARLHRAGLPTGAGPQDADRAPRQRTVRGQPGRLLRRAGAAGAGPPALPRAHRHRARPPPAVARTPLGHAARLPGRLAVQWRAPARAGRLAGAGGVLLAGPDPRRCSLAVRRPGLPHAAGAPERGQLQPGAAGELLDSLPAAGASTTFPARRPAPTGTAASPTTTCT